MATASPGAVPHGVRVGGPPGRASWHDSDVSEAADLSGVFATLLAARRPEYDEWLYRYCGALGTPPGASRWMRHLRGILDFAGREIDGAEFLDAGAGFGFAAVAAAAWGARSAVGIDSYGPMVRTARAYVPLLPGEWRDRVRFDEGSVDALPYEDGRFDIVLSKEAISHYRHVDAFVSEVWRVLRPGGVVVVSDGNNGRNARLRKGTVAIWRAAEEVGNTTVGGHVFGDSYRERRRVFIAERFPDLDAATLAEQTSRMTFAETAQALERGQQPDSRFSTVEPPVDPGTDAVLERLFDPYELGRRFTAAGFRTTVRGYWGGASGKLHLRVANGLLQRVSRLSIATAPGFELRAEKVDQVSDRQRG
jgi:2-polyprenyl-3-methyl-5-hydroxy-6-metoxy-1,4-benzoquinol methylase